MRNLTDIHHQLSAADQVYLEKRAEQIKIAEEEDAAGRIMARGFADELSKLAGEGYDLGPMNTGDNFKLRNKGPGGPNQQQQRSRTSQAAAGQAGGTSKGPTVGAPAMGRQSSQQPNARPKPPAPTVGGMAGPPGASYRPPRLAPKPPGGGAMAMNTPKPPGR